MTPLKKVLGRPVTGKRKVLLSVRHSAQVVAFFKTTGDGWQVCYDPTGRSKRMFMKPGNLSRCRLLGYGFCFSEDCFESIKTGLVRAIVYDLLSQQHAKQRGAVKQYRTVKFRKFLQPATAISDGAGKSGR